MITIDKLQNRIICADCLYMLKQLPDKCVDLVLIDPPYFGVVKNDWDNQWKTISEFQDWVGKIGQELSRVLKDNGSFYWFGAEKNIAYVQVELDKYFTLLNNITWHKPNGLGKKGVNLNNKSYGCITEHLLFYEKCRPIGQYLHNEIQRAGYTLSDIADLFPSKTGRKTGCVSNWITGKADISKEQYDKIRVFLGNGFCQKDYNELVRVWNKDKDAVNIISLNKCLPQYHPTQKPIELIEYLIGRSSNKHDIVLDCFSGSGTTAIACHNLKRRFICIEKDPEYWKASRERLEQAQKQQKLF